LVPLFDRFFAKSDTAASRIEEPYVKEFSSHFVSLCHEIRYSIMAVSKESRTSISDVNEKHDGIQEALDPASKTISGKDISSEYTPKRNESHDVEVANTNSSPDDSDVQSIAHSIGQQTNVLSTRQLLIAFPALSLALFVSFIDQTSVSTSIPSISSDLNAGSSTSWVGGSFLIASTAFQLINGRLSDIFGRKSCLMVCLGLLALGDLLCGFAKSATMLFVFRALAGVGAGGVNSIAMIIVSDVTTLQNRGYYQGILGAVIAIANGIGPFIGGVLVEKASWRWVFWIVPPLTVPAIVIILLFLPLRHQHEGAMDRIRKIDFAGVGLNIAAVLLILVSIPALVGQVFRLTEIRYRFRGLALHTPGIQHFSLE
jgi:hypothetical protein